MESVKRIVKKLLLALLAVLLILEEWLWDVLALLGEKLGVWLHLERIEGWLARAPRYAALAAFAVPVLIVTPLNLYAIGRIAQGHVLEGILLEVVAKLIGTLLIARVFNLTRAQLMSFGWFAWFYATIMGWLRWAHERLEQTWVYQRAKALKKTLRQWAGLWRNVIVAWWRA